MPENGAAWEGEPRRGFAETQRGASSSAREPGSPLFSESHLGGAVSWLLLLIVGLYMRLSGPLPADETALDPASVLAHVEPPPGTLPIFFLEGTRLRPVYRPKGPATPAHALEALLAGPTVEEQKGSLTTALPPGTRLLGLTRRGSETVVDLSHAIAPEALRVAVAQVTATLASFPEIRAARILVQGTPVRAVLAAQFLHLGTAAANRAPAGPIHAAQSPAEASLPRGPLSGKVIVISPGHGLTRQSNGRWRYQRPFFEGEVEDQLNIAFATHACRELRRLGATVHTTRAPEGANEPGISGAPRWMEAAKYYLRDIGMPDWVHQPLPVDFDSDIDARPLYANYLGADLLISLHSNIGPNTGTLTLYDKTNGFERESHRLARLLEAHVVRAIREKVDPGWRSHGAVGTDARYGENHWAHMPSAILEIGFISQRRDRIRLIDPRCQEAVGRAIAEAVAEYFGVPPTPLPGSPPPEVILPVTAPRPASPPVFVCAGDPAGASDVAYARQLQARLDDHHGRAAFRVIQMKGSACTVLECLRKWDEEVAPARPSHILLAFGRHDLEKDSSRDSRVPLARFEAALIEAVRRTRALGAVPILATMAPIDDDHFHATRPREHYAADGGVQALRDRYNNAIRRVAWNTNAALVDLSLAAWQHEEEWINPAVSGDQLTPRGVERLVSLILREVPALIGAQPDGG